MSKQLEIDSLTSEIESLRDLLSSAVEAGDSIGELQFEYRLEKLTEELTSLKENTLNDNSASVALFFGGQPVLGSKGIAAKFAGKAIEHFQNLVGKVFASNEQGELGQRGKIPFKENSELMVTGLTRGSFGFILDEMNDQVHLESSQLTHIIDKAAHLIKDSADQDENIFENLLEDLDPRSLIALKELFATLDSNKATIRIVEQNLDFTLNSADIYRAKSRTESTSIDEKTVEMKGVLVGFLPEHKKFEFRDSHGELIYGTATKSAVDQFKSSHETVIGKKCLLKITMKTVAPINRPSKEVFRLLEFLSF